jgi:hypothetical protein
MKRGQFHLWTAAACCSLLQLSRPPPAVDRDFKQLSPACGFAAGCLHQSGSRLPQLWACQKLVAPKPAA